MRDKPPPPPPPDQQDDFSCPVTALGRVDGKFWFLDVEGERRGLTARQLGARPEITALFLGDMGWLERRFRAVDPDGNVIGWKISRATEYLMDACRRAGIYGDHIVIRKPGVWAGPDSMPIAHCGDALFIDGEKRPAGARIDKQIFAAAAREVYPARPAGPEVGRLMQANIGNLWNFRDDFGDVMALGLVGQAYLAAALSWRANGFICGGSNAGKSNLLAMLRAMVPLSHYSTDTSKAGIEGAVNGRAVPSFLDETSERSDGHGGQILLDVVLSASGGTGTKGHRGTADGGVRSIEMVGSVIMASITPPAMQPQHRSRFVLIELLPPQAGADNTAAHQAAIERAREAGPALFGRALASFARYKVVLARFRDALKAGGCVPREMDQLGAILAGHWILTEDGEPDAPTASETVKLIGAFIRGADEMTGDDSPHRVLSMLMSKVVSLHRSTDQDSIGNLVNHALAPLSDATLDRINARDVLARWGIRAIAADEPPTRQNTPAPRMGPGGGLFIDPRCEPLRHLFKDTSFAGDRWMIELSRLDGARKAEKSLRVTLGMDATRAWWIPRGFVGEIDEDLFPP